MKCRFFYDCTFLQYDVLFELTPFEFMKICLQDNNAKLENRHWKCWKFCFVSPVGTGIPETQYFHGNILLLSLVLSIWFLAFCDNKLYFLVLNIQYASCSQPRRHHVECTYPSQTRCRSMRWESLSSWHTGVLSCAWWFNVGFLARISLWSSVKRTE